MQYFNTEFNKKYINTNKLDKINFTKDNFYVVIDFDRTITSNKSADSWDASGYLLPQEFKDELENLYNKYRPIELDYNLPNQQKEKEMQKWYSECMDLYYKYNLTKDILEKSINQSNLILRENMKEFLQELNKNNTPVIILSAGIGNVIEQFLKKENCYFDNTYIISNFIEFDENGKAKKFDNKKIIHTLNKTMENNLPQEWQEKIKQKEYAILLGDLIEDLNMADKNNIDKTLTIGFLENNIEENLDIYCKNFDIVIRI